MKSDGFASGDVESMLQDWEWAGAGVFLDRNHGKIE